MTTILFICSANKDRSRTAEDYFQEKYPEFQFTSAGTNQKICFQLGTEFLTKELLETADLIFAMESKHRKFAQSLLVSKKKIQVLDIPDHFTYYQPELIDLLKKKISF
jgi:predicted protein tyrosine phosphatase